jgi:IS5 family transposase
MYKAKLHFCRIEDFCLPFAGKLDPQNRWVRFAKVIPWDKLEKQYAYKFRSKKGAPAFSVRTALGALLIKEIQGCSDVDTVEQLKENPYLQYFIGHERYSTKAPFDTSSLTVFRKRIKGEDVVAMSELIRQAEAARHQPQEKAQKPDKPEEPVPTNQGKLIFDATCAPADIAFPTDLGLLNDARQKSEQIIDALYKKAPVSVQKPRTYRKNARKAFLKVNKKRKKTGKELHKAKGEQLHFLARNLRHIEKLAQIVSLSVLTPSWYRILLVITEVYRQQEEMYRTGKRRIANRIVSISQPHVRPIVRGKAGAATEFGMKISASIVNGWSTPERMSWENYNEGCDLINDIERYRQRYGCYPESVHVDKIYRTKENRQWCKERGIRLSGTPLGRPPKEPEKNRARQALIKADEGVRNAIEGKFGQGKRRFGLGRIMAKRDDTSETVVALIFMAMNLVRLLKVHRFFFSLLLMRLFNEWYKTVQQPIITNQNHRLFLQKSYVL